MFWLSLPPIIFVYLSPQLTDAVTLNCIIQFVVFLFLANIPALMTGRMSYVDLAWPWGLVSLSLPSLITSHPGQGWIDRRTLVSLAYFMAGLRMGMGALALWSKGHLQEEFPRYLYLKRRWAKKGITDTSSWRYTVEMQKEILVQGFANMGALAVPLLLQSRSYLTSSLTMLEVGAWVMWIVSYTMEHKADLQKKAFVAKCAKDGVKGAICEVGLWRYSRHPNYFFEFMVWCSLVISSLPSLFAFLEADEELFIVKIGVTGSLFLIVWMMYQCLVNYTGAKPAEFYSLQKRPAYADYQKRVNMFFPGPRKG